MRRILSFVLIIAVLFVFAGCAAADITRPKVDAGATMVDITGDISVTFEGEDIVLDVNSNIDDGALIKFSIQSVEGLELAKQIVTKDADTLTVKFDESVLGDKDEFYAFASCAPSAYGDQPDSVIEHYGESFEYLQGDSVIWDSTGVVVVYNSGVIQLNS
ncbi:MAG: hypothetical protein R2876_05035 [Eubacteriales bacterium]